MELSDLRSFKIDWFYQYISSLKLKKKIEMFPNC